MVARPLMRRLPAVGGRVDMTVLRPPTFDALKDALAAAQANGAPFHIVHFDGHGNFGVRTVTGGGSHQYDTGGPQGYLFFETADGNGNEPVAAGVFAAELARHKVPVVVLNACRSATLTDATGPEATVATRLVQHGVAAVVAMSHSVYAVAAAEFMATFYQSLFDGQPVAAAMADGRRQLRRKDERPSPKGPLPLADWMVPVLYAQRPVAFPGLQGEKKRGTTKLAGLLDALRAPAKPAEPGVHAASSLDAIGPFFGRDREFLRLERWLLHRPVVIIHGAAGSGKTELAKAFARWWRDTGGAERASPDSPPLVFFHSFEPGLASFGLDGVVSSIGLSLFGADFGRIPEAERPAIVLGAMARVRMLLVWDNFESVHSMPDPEGVTPPLDGPPLCQ